MSHKPIPYKQQQYCENSLINMPDGTDPRSAIKIFNAFVNMPLI